MDVKQSIKSLSDCEKFVIEKLRNWAVKSNNLGPIEYRMLFKLLTGNDDFQNRLSYERYVKASKVYWYYSGRNNFELPVPEIPEPVKKPIPLF
jgi:hypothetical protein